jgi:hypothetical protein
MEQGEVSQRRATAFHEAGHAVIGRAMGQLCGSVTIEPNEQEGEAGCAITFDHWSTMSAWDQLGRWREQSSILIGRVITYMAGRISEEVLLGHCQGGDGDDRLQIEMMLTALGRDGDADYRARLAAMTKAAVKRHSKTIEAVADLLLEKTALKPGDVSAVLPFISLGVDAYGAPQLVPAALPKPLENDNRH